MDGIQDYFRDHKESETSINNLWEILSTITGKFSLTICT